MSKCTKHSSRIVIDPNQELGDIVKVCSCEASVNGLATAGVTLGCIATCGLGLIAVGIASAFEGSSWLQNHKQIINYEYRNNLYNTLEKAREARAQDQLAKEKELVKQRIQLFNELIAQNLDGNLPSLQKKLYAACRHFEELVDNGSRNNPEIMNRYLILKLRKARCEFMIILQEDNQDNLELKNKIANLLETEIEIFKTLGLDNKELKEQLDELEQEIENLQIVWETYFMSKSIRQTFMIRLPG